MNSLKIPFSTEIHGCCGNDFPTSQTHFRLLCRLDSREIPLANSPRIQSTTLRSNYCDRIVISTLRAMIIKRERGGGDEPSARISPFQMKAIQKLQPLPQASAADCVPVDSIFQGSHSLNPCLQYPTLPTPCFLRDGAFEAGTRKGAALTY